MGSRAAAGRGHFLWAAFSLAALLRQRFPSHDLAALAPRASDKCQREKRKTINGDDLLWAMSTLGFEEYVEPLKAYLAKFREVRAAGSSVAGRLYVAQRPGSAQRRGAGRAVGPCTCTVG